MRWSRSCATTTASSSTKKAARTLKCGIAENDGQGGQERQDGQDGEEGSRRRRDRADVCHGRRFGAAGSGAPAFAASSFGAASSDVITAGAWRFGAREPVEAAAETSVRYYRHVVRRSGLPRIVALRPTVPETH